MAASRTPDLEWELEGEPEWETDNELEGELEGEAFLGTLGRIAGGVLGALGEEEGEWEGEFELEGEYEGEEFLGRAFRGISGFVRRAAPVLRSVARVAAPIVGTAVGGPLGATIGGLAARALGEEEFEGEFEGELEGEFEADGEFEDEAAAPRTPQDAVAELMADVAARAQSEAEAEAMIGAATVTTLSSADRAALRRMLPHLVRGTAILTRVLRQRGVTRPAVRVVPTIVRRTVRSLKQQSAGGRPVTQRVAARAMATQTRRVLGSPRRCAHALQRNVAAARMAQRRPPQARRRAVTG